MIPSDKDPLRSKCASVKRHEEPPIELEIECSVGELKEGNTRPGSGHWLRSPSDRCVVVERTRLGPGFIAYKAYSQGSRDVQRQESKPVTLPIRPGWHAGMRTDLRIVSPNQSQVLVARCFELRFTSLRIIFKGEGNHSDKAKQRGTHPDGFRTLECGHGLFSKVS